MKTLINPHATSVAFFISGVTIGWLAWGHSFELCPLFILLLPVIYSFAQSRWSASLLMLGYYLGGARGLPGGTAVFFGDDASIWLGMSCYLLVSFFLTLSFFLLWSKSSGWRFAVAMLVSIIPPLAFIGWINPIAIAGLLFPAMGWLGLGLAFVTMAVLAMRCMPVIAVLAVISVASNIMNTPPSIKWVGENTHFAQLGSGKSLTHVIDAMHRVDWLVKYADSVPANSVRVLPETIVGSIGGYAKYLLADVSNQLAKRNSKILVGGEIEQADGRYLNALVVLGEDKIAVQGVPVPISMWHPFGKSGAVADVWGHNQLIEVNGKKTGTLICYEQLLTYSMLWMMSGKPDVLLGAANVWWAKDTSIPAIQVQTMKVWGRLFGVPVVLAVNS